MSEYLSVEQQKDFINSIDFSEIFRYIERFTGVILDFSEPIINANRGEVYITWESQDILGSCGIFGKALTRCRVKASGGCGVRAYAEQGCGICFELDYMRKGGGSNGCELLRAHYTNGKWTYSA